MLNGFAEFSLRAPFGLSGIFSMLESFGRLFDDLCNLAALGGSSSSSLLRVKSTTWPAVRLVPDVGAGVRADEVDCSLDEMGGVLIRPGSRAISLFTEANREMSRISTRSSSPPLLRRLLEDLGGGGVFPVV